MQDINNLINRRLKKLGLAKQLEAFRIVEIANAILPRPCRAHSFSRGILTVACPDNIVAHEVQMSSHKIIDAINTKLPHPVIRRLRYRLEV